jgi:hypothetical protein
MRVALISSCTNRKKLPPSQELLARSLPEASISNLAQEWSRRLASAGKKIPARNLYAGRAFTEALTGTDAANADLYVVSAGLGLVSVESDVPSYSLTVVRADKDNVLLKATDGTDNPKIWWAKLNGTRGQERPLATLVEASPDCLFVFALPSTYLGMVFDDISTISAAAAKRIRIVGLPTLAAAIPKTLVSNLIVYDERMEAPDAGIAGTRSDFPQRAARHFVTSVLKSANSVSDSVQIHSARVSEFLSNFQRPKTPTRERHSDDMLKNVIRGMWPETQGRVTNGLKLLRRHRGIACEQSRFKRLFWEVAAEKRVAK